VRPTFDLPRSGSTASATATQVKLWAQDHEGWLTMDAVATLRDWDRMQPLKGLTVVTLEHAIAAPFATRQLADLGARVIKIERPGVGDFARGYDQRVRGLASHFVWTNRSKESLTLDVKHPRGRSAAAAADRRQGRRGGAEPGARRGGAAGHVLRRAEGPPARPDRLRHLGLWRRPGRARPYRDKKAYDLLIQSESGFVSITGTPDEPSKAGLSIADIAAGMYAYSNILAALLQRGSTAGAGASTSRCWKPWPSGWATRCTTRSTARRRRRAPARRTPPSTPTGRSPPATASR
jgi:hypothetical protein